jgi:hypothetical protein
MSKILILSIFLIVPSKCQVNRMTKEEINRLIESKDKTDQVIGFYVIGQRKDTSYIPRVLSNAADPRITHHRSFYGFSVYQSKMGAMRNISGEMPPRRLTSEPDSVIIKFYTEWAWKKGFILHK